MAKKIKIQGKQYIYRSVVERISRTTQKNPVYWLNNFMYIYIGTDVNSARICIGLLHMFKCVCIRFGWSVLECHSLFEYCPLCFNMYIYIYMLMYIYALYVYGLYIMMNSGVAKKCFHFSFWLSILAACKTKERFLLFERNTPTLRWYI